MAGALLSVHRERAVFLCFRPSQTRRRCSLRARFGRTARRWRGSCWARWHVAETPPEMPPRAGEGQPCTSEWARRRRRAGGSAVSFSAAKWSRRVGGAAFDPHWRGASSLPWKEAVASLAAPPRGPRGVGVLRRPDRPSFRQVNETLYRQGYATVHDLQLLRVDFNSNYEESPLQRRAARQRCVQEEITQLRGVNRTPSPTSSCRSSSR